MDSNHVEGHAYMSIFRIMDTALKILSDSGIDQYEVYAIDEARMKTEALDGQVDSFERSRTRGLAARVLVEKRLGFSYCTEDSPEAVRQCVLRAIDGAKGSAPDHLYSLTPPTERGVMNHSPAQNVAIYDPSMKEVDEVEKIQRALALEKSARDFDRRIVKTHRASYQEVEVRVWLKNSLGLDLNAEATRAYCQIMAIAAQGNEQEMGWEFDSSCTYAGLDVERVGREAARKAVEMLGAKGVPSGRYHVLFEPGAAAEMVEFVSASFVAENVLKHKSMLADKLHQKAFSPLISMVDDGLKDGGLGSFPFDGEGSPSQTTTVVEKGTVSTFLCDRYCARRMETGSTGNSQRNSIFAPPTVGVTNFFIRNGETAPAALIRDVSSGLVVRELMGMHTANPVTGDFSLGATGFWFRGGEPAHPVKGIALAGNVIELLARVDGVGNDLRFLHTIGAPSIRVEMLDVSGQ